MQSCAPLDLTRMHAHGGSCIQREWHGTARRIILDQLVEIDGPVEGRPDKTKQDGISEAETGDTETGLNELGLTKTGLTETRDDR